MTINAGERMRAVVGGTEKQEDQFQRLERLKKRPRLANAEKWS
jgi:hypothetical protein